MLRKKFEITDIVAIGGSGEFDSQTVSGPPVPRILQTIELTSNFTAKIHNENFCEEKIQLTRLAFNEFSFYTNKAPLTLNDYKELINYTYDIATKLPSNINLVIGTFAVLWPDGYIHNCAFYVQSPSSLTNDQPNIYHFDKYMPYKDDYKYLNSDNSNYLLYHEDYMERDFDYYKTDFSPNIVLADTKASVNSIRQYQGAILVPVNNLNCVVVNEICYEHQLGVGKTSEKILKDNLEIAPDYTMHVLISKSISILPKNVVGSIIHADPLFVNDNCYSKKMVRNLDDSKFGNNLKLHVFEPYKVKKNKSKSSQSLNLFQSRSHSRKIATIDDSPAIHIKIFKDTIRKEKLSIQINASGFFSGTEPIDRSKKDNGVKQEKTCSLS